jgi:hypothetical protein
VILLLLIPGASVLQYFLSNLYKAVGDKLTLFKSVGVRELCEGDGLFLYLYDGEIGQKRVVCLFFTMLFILYFLLLFLNKLFH